MPTDALRTETLVVLWLLLAVAVFSTVEESLELGPAIFTVDGPQTIITP